VLGMFVSVEVYSCNKSLNPQDVNQDTNECYVHETAISLENPVFRDVM